MYKGNAPGLIFREESFHIGDRHKSRKQLLLLAKARNEHWLMHKSKMNARFVAADRTVECRVTMEEVRSQTRADRDKTRLLPGRPTQTPPVFPSSALKLAGAVRGGGFQELFSAHF